LSSPNFPHAGISKKDIDFSGGLHSGGILGFGAGFNGYKSASSSTFQYKLAFAFGVGLIWFGGHPQIKQKHEASVGINTGRALSTKLL
jgi:hypothetical protein